VLRYALQRGEPKVLSVQYGFNYNRLTVWLDNEVIGEVLGRKLLLAGQTFPLSDGAALSVKLERSRLRLARNGIALPGTVGDPFLKVAGSSYCAGFIALFSLLSFGLRQANTAIYTGLRPLDRGIDIVLIGTYAVLALLIYKRQRWAVWTALGIYGLDMALAILYVVQGQSSVLINPVSIIVHLLFLRVLYQALPGLEALDAQVAILAAEKARASPTVGTPAIASQPYSANSWPLSQPGAPSVNRLDNLADFEPWSASPAWNAQSTETTVKLAPPPGSDPRLVTAYGHIEKGNPSQARPLLIELLRSKPTNAYAWYLISFATSAPAQRVEALQRAVRYDSNFIAARDRLAELSR